MADKDYEEMTDEERMQNERDNLEDEYHKDPYDDDEEFKPNIEK